MFAILTAAVLLSLGSAGLAGQEDGLYGSGAPDDSAFVRLVNARGEGEVSTSIGGTELGPVPAADASPYRPVAVGLYSVHVGGQSAELIAEDATYYTIALTASSLLVLQDPEHTDPTEAQLFLYNLTSLPTLRLVATERNISITEFVASGESMRVSVTPVTVDLALYSDATEIASLGDPGLERGESYSVFAYEDGEQTGVFVKQAQVVAE